VLEFRDVSFDENLPKTLVFIRMNTSGFTKAMFINSSIVVLPFILTLLGAYRLSEEAL